MLIGIIGAMKVEVEKLKERMSCVETTVISGIRFYRGELWGKDIVLAVSGIGKVNAALCTQTMILKFSPSIIINTGVAGGIEDFEIGSIIIGNSVVQHDMDTSPIGDPKGMIPGINMIEIPCSHHVLDKLKEAARKSDLKIYTGVIATGDQFMNDRAKIQEIHKMFNAVAFEMESGSIGQVCYINGVDFGIVRAVSDSGDENSHIDYVHFVESAADNAVQLVRNFLCIL